MPSTRIKVCCIENLDEARMAVDHGAAALGLVSAMPNGPGVITEAVIPEAIKQVRPFGVDLCSGVRTECRLDERKLAAFMMAVREADGIHQ